MSPMQISVLTTETRKDVSTVIFAWPSRIVSPVLQIQFNRATTPEHLVHMLRQAASNLEILIKESPSA